MTHPNLLSFLRVVRPSFNFRRIAVINSRRISKKDLQQGVSTRNGMGPWSAV